MPAAAFQAANASFAREGRLTIGLQVTNLPHSKWPISRAG
jgi:hypothetical protein